MRRVEIMADPEDFARYTGTALYAARDTESFASHAPDVNLVLLEGGEPLARASLWWSAVPPLEGERLGVIGHYAASGDEAGRELLAAACERLAAEGCSEAVGPMDGNTWRRYRFVTERGDEPAFLLEPDNPDAYPLQWRSAGFEPFAGYVSSLDTDLSTRDERMLRVEGRMADEGVTIRRFDPAHAERDLSLIHRVSLVSFRNNVLYTPLDEASFVEQYRPLLPHVRPELVLLAESAEEPVGFAFALPDLAQPARGVPLDTVIVKTVAVLPGRAYAGLGAALAHRVRAAAGEAGFTRAIHALMHDSNASRVISSHFGSPMRRYELFARRLA